MHLSFTSFLKAQTADSCLGADTYSIASTMLFSTLGLYFEFWEFPGCLELPFPQLDWSPGYQPGCWHSPGAGWCKVSTWQHWPLHNVAPYRSPLAYKCHIMVTLNSTWGSSGGVGGGEEEVRGREGALARATTQHGTWPPPWLLGKVISKSLSL